MEFIINHAEVSIVFVQEKKISSVSSLLFVGPWSDHVMNYHGLTNVALNFPYLQVLQLWTLTQNVSFIVAGITVVILLAYPGLEWIIFVSLVMLTYLSGAMAVLSTLAGTILIEREW